MFLKKICKASIVLLLWILPLQGMETLTFTSIKNAAFENFALSVMKKVYLTMDIKIALVPVPAKRSLKLANSGDGFDGELFRISGVEKTYTNLIPIEVPLHESNWMVYSQDKNIKVNGWESLRPYKIGIRRGVVTTEKGTQGMDIEVVNNNEQLFELLQRKRIDVAILSSGNGQKLLKKSIYSNIYQLTTPVHKVNVYHYIHKKNKHLVPKVTEIMKKFKQEGILMKIREKTYPSK